MSVKVGINGFGRIGRNSFALYSTILKLRLQPSMILQMQRRLAHLLKYDSVFGILNAEVAAKDNCLIVNGREIRILAERSPEFTMGELRRCSS